MGRWFTSKALLRPGTLSDIQGHSHAVLDPDAFQERAAIMEFDGGMARKEAETVAAQEQDRASVARFAGRLTYAEIMGLY